MLGQTRRYMIVAIVTCMALVDVVSGAGCPSSRGLEDEAENELEEDRTRMSTVPLGAAPFIHSREFEAVAKVKQAPVGCHALNFKIPHLQCIPMNVRYYKCVMLVFMISLYTA